MVVNVYQTIWVDLHAPVCHHTPDNYVKIVSENTKMMFFNHELLFQVLILVPVNHAVMVVLVSL
jgi:hypothetical protein